MEFTLPVLPLNSTNCRRPRDMLGNPRGGIPGKPLPVTAFQSHSNPQSLSAQPPTPVRCVHQSDRMTGIEIDPAEAIKGGGALVLFCDCLVGGLSHSCRLKFLLFFRCEQAKRGGYSPEIWIGIEVETIMAMSVEIREDFIEVFLPLVREGEPQRADS